MIVEAWDSYS